ncbi:hypothetical protein LOAG_04068 [Loa loa]|uniref:Uncharacterized protein n=1 Tax=Loa loa TaxID=7209 RepID=A0A1S0U2U3_LOALO|nr:hypothetical protein LOAG_04068 [Loa loa]EFO24416.1 hypothetical protein LOAG_04068 [Loa loa]
MKDEMTEKRKQRVISVSGRMMFIEGQVGIDRKHYMIGILGNGNDENFDSKRILDSIAKSRKFKRNKRGILNKPSSDRIFQPKKPLKQLLKNTIKQMRIQQDISRKKELPQELPQQQM